MAKLYGKGTIKELDKGKKYRIQLSIGKNPVTGKYDRHTETFLGTYRQAQLRIEELRRQYASGKAANADSVVFSDWCDRFLSGREGLANVKPETLRHNRNTSKHLLKYLGDVRVVDISPVNVTDMYAAMRADGVGDSTIFHCHKLMKQIMADAVNNDICLRNPMDRVATPRKPKPKRKALSSDESKRLANIVTSGEPSANTTAVYTYLATGTRLGEVLGLKWDYVFLDEERPYIYFLYQLNRRGELVSLKTDDDDNPIGRVVPIDESTVSVLRAWKDAQREYLSELCIEQTGDTFVITNSLGSHCDHTNFERWWRSFCVKHGFGKMVDDEGREIVALTIGQDASEHSDCVIEWRDADGWPCDASGRRYSRSYKRPKVKSHYQGLTIHELRHTHFTHRLANGMDIPTAQALGGWSTPAMLLTTYAHPVPENVWASAGFMDALTNEEKGDDAKRFAHDLHNSEGGKQKSQR